MGIFSKNRTDLGSYNGAEIVADESYYGELGALTITLEGLQNDQDIFTACLEGDFEETAGLLTGAITESQILEEAGGAFSSFIEKIKTMVKKIAEKLKGLFSTFIKKINSVIIRDNKKFVDKYKREVLTKDLSKMKFKYQKPKDIKGFSIDAAQNEVDKIIGNIASSDNIGKEAEKLDDGTYTDSIYAKIVSGTDADSFAKDYHEQSFDDEEEVEGLSGSELSSIIELLTGKKIISELETKKKKIDKVFSDYLRVIDKKCNNMAANIPGDTKNKDGSAGGIDYMSVGTDRSKTTVTFTGNKTSKDTAMKKLSLIQRTVSLTQSIYSTVTAAEIKETKFKIAQARKVFAKAVSYNPKKVNESTFMEAAGDAAFYDVMSSFESYEM